MSHEAHITRTHSNVTSISPVPSTLGSTLISASSEDSQGEAEPYYAHTKPARPQPSSMQRRRRPMPSVIVSPQPEGQLPSLRDVYMAHAGSNARFHELLQSGDQPHRIRSFSNPVGASSRSVSMGTSVGPYSRRYDEHLSRYRTIPDPYYAAASSANSIANTTRTDVRSTRAVTSYVDQYHYSRRSSFGVEVNRGDHAPRDESSGDSRRDTKKTHGTQTYPQVDERRHQVMPTFDVAAESPSSHRYPPHHFEPYQRDPNKSHNTPTKEVLQDPRYTPERKREGVMVEAAIGKPALRDMSLMPKRFAVKYM